jgi:hypothetical protein
MTTRQRWLVNAVIVALMIAAVVPWGELIPTPPGPPATKTIVAAVYVYEKDINPPSPSISRAIQRINKETEIEAGETDDDNTTNPQFAPSIAAAAGKSCLVLTYADGTLETVEVENGEDIAKAVGL